MMTMVKTIPPRTTARSFSRRITASRTSVARITAIRRDLGTWLEDHPRADDAMIVADELLSNGLIHGSADGDRISLVASRLMDEYLKIDVTDAGRADTEPPCVAAEGLGRGLHMVESLCENVDIDRSGGWSVHAVLAPIAPPVVVPDVDVHELLGDEDGSAGRG